MRHLNSLTRQQPRPAQLEAAIQFMALLQSILGFLTDLRKFKGA